MKFTIISKASIQYFPRITSLAIAARDLGYQVVIISQNIDSAISSLLNKNEIEVRCIENPVKRNKLLKLFHWYRFAKFANKEYLQTSKDDIVWITGADTAICMGIRTLRKRDFFFQINELYDTLPFYLKKLNEISKYAREIIVPEENRACIFRVWLKLKKTPKILYNKPYFSDCNIDDLDQNLSSIINEVKKIKENNIIILYQGQIFKKERDLTSFIKYFQKIPNVKLILMGYDHNTVNEYKQIDPCLMYVKPIPAPYHLKITELADIGILYYSPCSLNNIFCAPNKTWEYTKYGLALLGNDIPGLKYIEKQHIGINIDFDDEANFKEKIDFLIENHKSMQVNSYNYFNSINYIDQLRTILI